MVISRITEVKHIRFGAIFRTIVGNQINWINQHGNAKRKHYTRQSGQN